MTSARLIVHHIPVCPFSQRLEILLELKGRRDAVDFRVVDITRPRAPELLAKTRGSTALPVLELPDGRILKESLVILRYLEDTIDDPPVAQRDPWKHAIEHLLVRMEGDFVSTGYRLVMAQDEASRAALRDAMRAQYVKLDAFLVEHAPRGPFLHETFGWAETVFTPFFWRFEFLPYYEGFDIPDEPDFARVRAWRAACLAHPAAQQVSVEEIVKLYYDYSLGVGNGALPDRRTRSSFVFEPDWRSRPWPPRGKPRPAATDAELGLLGP
ncbi:MAG: glutathione S-transferase family protein [Burkholderiaceae bacterium]|jgi:glutathione S-transferase|nr:glutathione S-transferase family protein [Burkholderiaceae bacterium]MCZ8112862.1 glutathione S-transferase family protein [Rubrivivax sp.]MCZ8177348.1 glutathione S-transferase family protein [Burkholderiaceae bacterium]